MSKKADEYLSAQDREDIRGKVMPLLMQHTMTDTCRIIAGSYDLKPCTIEDIARNRGIYFHPGYTKPETVAVCNRCGKKRPVCYFYHDSEGRRKGLCIKCNSERYYYDMDEPPPDRDPFEDENFWCPICGIGVSEDGKVFGSQEHADKCCENATIPRGNSNPSPGKYLMPRGKFNNPDRSILYEYMVPFIPTFNKKRVFIYGKQYWDCILNQEEP